jgi:phosphatidylglycerophosphate synthase
MPGLQHILKAIPNTLTVLRLVAGVAFPFVPAEWWLPLLLFGGISDLIDGWLSRIWNGTSTFGQLLDPVADKVFVLAVAGTLLLHGVIGWGELLWLGARDVAVVALSLIAVAITTVRPADLRPRLSGKVATGAQFGALLWLVIQQQPAPGVVFAAGVVSAIAAVDYTFAAYRNWSGRPAPSP